MLSSLARSLGLGNHVSEPGDLGFLAVLAVWAPGQASWSNQIEMEGAIAVCLDMVGKETSMFRFPSDRHQPDRICHRLATALEACKLNSQHFICWFSLVDAASDVAMTIAASLVELGMVDSATVQYEPLVTTIEGSLCTPALVCYFRDNKVSSPSRGEGGENRMDLRAGKTPDECNAQRCAGLSMYQSIESLPLMQRGRQHLANHFLPCFS